MSKLIPLEEEILASRIHDIWSKWFLHQLKNSSPENIERWMYQSSIDYADLSEEDKEKDRKQVRKLLEWIKTIDPIAIIDAEIQKHEYLSAKFLQDSGRVTWSIDFKRMSDIEKWVAIALKDIKCRLLLTQK